MYGRRDDSIQTDLLASRAREYRLPLIKYFQKRVPRTVEPGDLVQDVFMRLAKGADLTNIDRIDGYLFQTAASVLADRFRRDLSNGPDTFSH